jgi:hypothetical protein
MFVSRGGRVESWLALRAVAHCHAIRISAPPGAPVSSSLPHLSPSPSCARSFSPPVVSCSRPVARGLLRVIFTLDLNPSYRDDLRPRAPLSPYGLYGDNRAC